MKTPPRSLSEVHKILMIRSSPVVQFRKTFEQIRKKFQSATIDVMVQEDVSGHFSAEGSEKIIIPPGHFSFRNLDPLLSGRIRKMGVDLLVIPSNHDQFSGYSEMVRASLAWKIPRIKFVHPIAGERDLGSLRCLFYLLCEKWRKWNLSLEIKRIFPKVVYRFLRLIHSWIPVRFGGLYNSRLGHFAANLEVRLCEQKCGLLGRKSWEFFYLPPNSDSANQQLEKMWKRTLKISPLALEVENWIRNKPKGMEHLIHWRKNQDRDIHGVLSRTQPHISFNRKEKDLGKKALLEMGLQEDKPYICFYARDREFMKKTFPERPHQGHDYRNCDIESTLRTVKTLVDKGYYALRMGSIVEKPLETSHPRIIDYAGQFRSDFLDIYLPAKCQFFLGCSSGIMAVPMVFRRPLVWVNYIPLEYAPTWGTRDIFIPKKLWLKKENRLMTFNEILTTGAGRYLRTEQYQNNDIEIIDNTPQEILDVALEMEARLKEDWVDTKEDSTLQKSFWSLFPTSELNLVFQSRIGANFLRENQTLLQ